MAPKKMADCHPERPHHARGYCNPCYRRFIQKGEPGGTLAADMSGPKQKNLGRPGVPSLAKQQGAQINPNGKAGAVVPIDPPPLNTFDFAVTDHVVRLLLKHAMDKNKVIDELIPGGNPFEKGKMLDQLETDVRIKTALQRDLTKAGLDDQSKDSFVQMMWHWLKNDSDPRKATAAARILGKAFIAERVETTKIEKLPIEGFEDGLRRMLSEPVVEVPEGGSDERLGE